MKTTMNTELQNAKTIMSALMNCVKDKSISIQERNQYYKEYLELAQSVLILSKIN
jgi:hypothetical protein